MHYKGNILENIDKHYIMFFIIQVYLSLNMVKLSLFRIITFPQTRNVEQPQWSCGRGV